MSVDWGKVKSEYINGNISYKKLANKHGIAFQTLRDRAIKEKWFERRKEQRKIISIKTDQKIAEKIAEQNSNLAVDINNAAKKLLEKLNIAIEQTDLYIERTKVKVPQKVKDTKTGETYTAWKEEEKIRLEKKDSINVSSVNQLTGALRTLQTIQMATQENKAIETPQINITIASATPADRED